ncbi:trehalose 6-phosphate phosphatase [Sphingobium sp. B11D3B]|uniref:trehalose-phosphatase n=1 Tax=Sphingobium sp. B11D3B TaxID=2940575 RepID=UPI0022272755|nr:trehalose-phosphatase [Sphingobium sp. B11D3B]MCW2388973.1 trehalose 6-phosphate phosphatase [Sphingobium sp. B11D3B]
MRLAIMRGRRTRPDRASARPRDRNPPPCAGVRNESHAEPNHGGPNHDANHDAKHDRGITISHPSAFDLPAPSIDTLDHLSLFLDLDGTLFELIDHPEEVIADERLRSLLTRLSTRLDGRLAVVSGRSIAQIDAILGPIAQDLAVSGSHGSEHRWRGVAAHPVRPKGLDEAAADFRAFAGRHEGVIVEDKSYGVALHFRMAPQIEAEATALATRLADDLGLHYQPGKMMTELRMPGGDKGKAVRTLMSRAPMAGTSPWFLGDDETDEAAFLAAQALGGVGVIVGDRRPTAAQYKLANPRAVHAWLEDLL